MAVIGWEAKKNKKRKQTNKQTNAVDDVSDVVTITRGGEKGDVELEDVNYGSHYDNALTGI